MNATLRTRLAAAGLALTLAAGLAACGDDDGETAGGDGPPIENPGGDPTEPATGSMSEAACEASVDLSAAMVGPDDDDVVGWIQSSLQPAAETLASEFDPELTAPGAAAEILAEAFADAAESGDLDAVFESDEIAGALSTIGNAAHRSCDFQAVDIDAVEYGYPNLPDTLESGLTSFALRNNGIEDHEIVIFRRAEGATETLDELLELPEEEAMAKMEFTGVAWGGPGRTTYTVVDLEPGTYFAVCFIPVGGADGPPHFMEGMSGTFTVA